MSKLLTFFLFMFVGMTILGSVMQGSGGISTTELNGAIDEDDATIIVNSTVGFPNIDFIIIDNERILYAGINPPAYDRFTGCTRGYGGTEATVHSDEAHVYIFESSMINQMMGYNITAVMDEGGILMSIRLGRAILSLLVNAIGIQFTFLGTELALFSYFYMAMAIGLIITISMWIFGGK